MHSIFSLNSANFKISDSCGAFSTLAASLADVTNLSVSINLSGNRYVMIGLIHDGSANSGYVGGVADPSGTSDMVVAVLRGATQISNWLAGRTSFQHNTLSDQAEERYANFGILAIDRPTQGTYTYKVQANTDNVGVPGYLLYAKLFAMELVF